MPTNRLAAGMEKQSLPGILRLQGGVLLSYLLVGGSGLLLLQEQSLLAGETTQPEIQIPPDETPFGTLLPAAPPEQGNAADSYIQTIRSVSARLTRLGVHDEKDYARGLPLTSEEVQGIVAGSKKQDSAFAPRYYPMSLGGFDPELNVVAIRTIDNGVLERGDQLEAQGNLEEAKRLYESLVMFGWHLKREKRSLVQYMLGIVTQSLGCQGLQKFYARQDGDAQAAMYGACYNTEQARLRLVATKHHLMEEDGEFAGHVLQQDADPLWRREAAQYVFAHVHAMTDGAALLQRVGHDDRDESVRAAALAWAKRLGATAVSRVDPAPSPDIAHDTRREIWTWHVRRADQHLSRGNLKAAFVETREAAGHLFRSSFSVPQTVGGLVVGTVALWLTCMIFRHPVQFGRVFLFAFISKTLIGVAGIVGTLLMEFPLAWGGMSLQLIRLVIAMSLLAGPLALAMALMVKMFRLRFWKAVLLACVALSLETGVERGIHYLWTKFTSPSI